MSLPSNTDVVSVESLQLTANIGPDCWGRSRAQPVLISIHLHLRPSFLTRAAATDDVQDSVHYGHLSKLISSVVAEREAPFIGTRDLINVVTQEAFTLAGEAATAVRVVLDVPKLILLASGFSVDVTTPIGADSRDVPATVFVRNIVLAVVIGVNPPEREAKQQVIINLVFHEKTGPSTPVDYTKLIGDLSKEIERTAYLTLEKFVMEIVSTACRASDAFMGITARAQKPSALAFAHSSGVEITRRRSDFV